MNRGVKIPWVGEGQNPMGRGSKYIGREVKIPWIRGVNMPWMEGSIYHGQGGQNTVDGGFDIPYG
jgi:hypothetical protein